MFLRDESLVRLMIAFGARTVLCAGNGLSLEPHVLSYAGFEVTAADLSSWATEYMQHCHPASNFLKRRLYGSISFRSVRLYSSLRGKLRHLGWEFNDLRKHLFNPLKCKGGTLEFLAGDLLDPEFCPGTFDVIIERRTVQLYSPADCDRILERLTARLAPRGIFLSHCHMGWWRPGEPRTHPLEQWFHDHGFVVNPRSDYADIAKSSGRVAVLFISTG